MEAAYWLTPLPIEGLLSLVCAWPEIGLPVTRTDIILPDLAVRAAEAVPLWDAAEDSEAQSLRTVSPLLATPAGSWARGITPRPCLPEHAAAYYTTHDPDH